MNGELEFTHIGDGVYAAYDGWNTWLRVNDPKDAAHQICLEPAVRDELMRFVQRESDKLEDTPVMLTVEQALAMLPDGDEIHTFWQSVNGILIGADWPRAELEDAIRKAERRELAGPGATQMGHGLAMRLPGGRRDLFVETRNTRQEPQP